MPGKRAVTSQSSKESHSARDRWADLQPCLETMGMRRASQPGKPRRPCSVRSTLNGSWTEDLGQVPLGCSCSSGIIRWRIRTRRHGTLSPPMRRPIPVSWLNYLQKQFHESTIHTGTSKIRVSLDIQQNRITNRTESSLSLGSRLQHRLSVQAKTCLSLSANVRTADKTELRITREKGE